MATKPSDDTWDEGEKAFEEGKSLIDNPHRYNTYSWRDWRRGFIHAYYEKHGNFP